MAEKLLDMGQGLELWRVGLDEMKEQDVNARAMPVKMFDRLSTTIQRDGRLEALPFCAKTDRGLEIVSGHHRVRAARTAGLETIFALVDVSGLNRSKIRAKQLAHNSIQGVDDKQLLAQIYQEIDDAEAKLEAFIDAGFDSPIVKAKIDDVMVELSFDQLLIMFLPVESEIFERAVARIEALADKKVMLAEHRLFEPFCELVNRVGKEYDIRAVGTILSKVSEIVLTSLGEDVSRETGMVHLRDVFKTAYVPVDLADELESILKEIQEADPGTKKDRVAALRSLVARLEDVPCEP
jgi:stage III sporulation protein SpoIIIAA